MRYQTVAIGVDLIGTGGKQAGTHHCGIGFRAAVRRMTCAAKASYLLLVAPQTVQNTQRHCVTEPCREATVSPLAAVMSSETYLGFPIAWNNGRDSHAHRAESLGGR